MTKKDLGPAIGRLFARQDGLVTPRQLEAVGVTRSYVRTRLDKGEWTKLSGNVIGSNATPDSWRRRVRGAWFDAGSAVLDLLDKRVNGRLPRSWFQRLAKRILDDHGVALTDEHPVFDPDTGRALAHLDLADLELRIGVECQSWEWHGTPSAQARDARRRRRLRVLGWEIVDVWWTDLHAMDEIVAEIRFLIDQRPPRGRMA